ncbi:hypothetical protein F5Y00DRAFT_273058 [Daldinia vernicosa]|uniref:uncharacterized protein n=1 Tax=Daldinia vernicosa TaxID=114800 RepID=UPI002008707F|nr:uncharacterized protein F5Y00DRAFT_273058 [Daldinia vernicosa]KAI0845269.1 hypothetical protein F5Y00DRAFT_273058 [Daldinia vernicosa]
MRIERRRLRLKDMTNVGSNGITLSGGQKQRVSLARCLYLQSNLLIMDDVFSGLDADTEDVVFQRVVTSVDNRTNGSKHKELLGVIDIYHGLVLEFAELLCLLSPDKAEEPEGKEARKLYEKGLSPTEILGHVRRTPKQGLILEVQELRQYDRRYEKLEDIRAAITKVNESGLRVLFSLHNDCDEAWCRAMDGPGIKLTLEEPRSGAFHLPGRHMPKEEFLKDLYKDGFKPAPATFQLFRCFTS